MSVRKQNQKATGYVILPRLDFEFPKDEILYQRLVLRAKFKNDDEAERGQLITSYVELCDEIGWSYDSIRNSFKRLKNLKLIDWMILHGRKGLLVTVRGYERMQDLSTYRQEERKQPPVNPLSPPSPAPDAPKIKWMDMYLKAFGKVPNAFQLEQMHAYMDKGISDELICLAIERIGTKGWKIGALWSLLNDWEDKQIRTMDAAKQEMENHDKQYAAKSQNGYKRGAPLREEKAPDWFGKQKQEQKEPEESTRSPEEVEAERQKLLKELGVKKG